MKNVFLVSVKVLLVGWSFFYLFVAGLGFLYGASSGMALLRPGLWISFSYGFGCLFSIYCVLSCVLPFFRWKMLLFSGIVMQILAFYCIYWSYHFKLPINYQYALDVLNIELFCLSIFLILWWLHFIAVFINQSEPKATLADVIARQ